MDITTHCVVGRPRVGAALLNCVSRTALAAFTMGLALGVVLPGEARADCFFNGASSVTYNLSCSSTTSGPLANISPPGPSANGVYGNSSMPWNVTNNGSITGVAQGSGYYGAVSLASSGSSVTNTGTIRANGQHSVGIGLSGVGTVSNNAGRISANFIGVYMGGAGSVNNSAYIGGTGSSSLGVVLNHGGTVNNYSSGTISGTNAVSLG